MVYGHHMCSTTSESRVGRGSTPTSRAPLAGSLRRLASLGVL
jgi:hypothetical protein